MFSSKSSVALLALASFTGACGRSDFHPVAESDQVSGLVVAEWGSIAEAQKPKGNQVSAVANSAQAEGGFLGSATATAGGDGQDAYGVTIRDDQGKLYHISFIESDNWKVGGKVGTKTLSNVAHAIEVDQTRITVPIQVTYENSPGVDFPSGPLIDEDGFGCMDIDWVQIERKE